MEIEYIFKSTDSYTLKNLIEPGNNTYIFVGYPAVKPGFIDIVDNQYGQFIE